MTSLDGIKGWSIQTLLRERQDFSAGDGWRVTGGGWRVAGRRVAGERVAGSGWRVVGQALKNKNKNKKGKPKKEKR